MMNNPFILWFLSLSLTHRILLGGLVVVMLYQLGFIFRYLLLKKQHREERQGDLPGVSVIVAARNEADNLRVYLQALLEQDYPLFEVIAVNDGSEDNTWGVLEEYANRYTNLHITFVPCGAKVISSKKLALTLGVKAARYDYLLFTDADCRPASPRWISTMMQGFTSDDTEVVLGFGAYFRKKGILNRLIRYETLITGLQYLGMAAARHPYMGVGRNLAYTKSLFERQRGFVGLTGEQAGDDDLFINRVANGKNTRIIYGKDSLTWSVPETTWKGWWQQRKRHLSVSSHYRTASRLHIGLEPLTRAIFYSIVIAMVAVATPLLRLIAVATFLLRWLILWIVLNVSAKRVGVPSIGLELMLWDWLYPILTLWMLLFSRTKKQTYW